jgi:hypothetical protein
MGDCENYPCTADKFAMEISELIAASACTANFISRYGHLAPSHCSWLVSPNIKAPEAQG